MRTLAAVLLLVLAGCVAPKPLPVLGQVPEFELTAQDGRTFSSRALDGHVWVANFIYTTCPGPCPMMSSQMRQVQIRTAGAPDVRLVSFTVDPAHDTPPVLAEYARHFQHDPARWCFLTGDQARLNDLGMNTFHLNGVDGSLTHSTRFVLMDRARRIRGYYLSGEEGFLPELLRGIRRLESEKP